MRQVNENGVWPPASPFRSPRGRFQNLLQDEAEQQKLPLPFLYSPILGCEHPRCPRTKKGIALRCLILLEF